MKVPSKLKVLFSSSGNQKEAQGQSTSDQTPRLTIPLALSPSRASSRLATPNPASSQISLPITHASSPPPPWQTWTFDQDFLRKVKVWNETHPENTLDRILNGTCAIIDQHNVILELVPDGPIPIRGFVRALAHLVKLGATILEAKAMALRFARDIVQWVERLASAFGDSENGRSVSQTWDSLTEIRNLIDDIFVWVHRMLNGGLTERVSVNDEILSFQMQFMQATDRFVVLSGINVARSHDALARSHDALAKRLDILAQDKQMASPTLPDVTYEYQKKYPCDPGTRKEILGDIMKWTTDISDTARCFFWMSGDPGVGKSAITASIAKESKCRRVLWAQLFINRNDARTVDPRLFFPSIAQQMAKSSLAVEHAVQESLREQPELMKEDISIDQAKKLFIDTVRIASKSTPTLPVVIVIDALDEIDFKRLAVTVEILSEVLLGLPRNAKVFISSRAEEVIRDVFGPQLTHTRVQHMHLSAKDSISEVTTFLERRVAVIMKKYHIDWSQWGEERMRKLCTQASGLFIWAVTAIEYIQAEIEEGGKECLGVVLDQLNAHGMEDVNALYLTILNQTYRRESGPWRYQRFRRIMGAILVQQSPLCIEDIEGLLDLRNPVTHTAADIEHFVRRLRTVLVAGTGEINKRTFPRVHRSFSDFVTSAGAEDFRVDTIDSDGELAIQCIRQLSRLWPQKNATEPELEMSAQLPYAVSHWPSHITRVVGVKMEQAGSDNGSISTSDTSDIVLGPETNSGAQVGIEATKKHTSSRNDVYCITFSPDGTHMAIAKYGFISLRNAQSGDEVFVLDHPFAILCVAFSPDGKRVVSASWNRTIRIWNSETGDLVSGPLEDHMGSVWSVVFSPDGRRIVSASVDNTIRVWNSDTGEMVLGPLEGHTNSVFSAAFSPDGRFIVSASEDKTIRVWDSQSGDMVLGPLEGHSSAVRFAIFSADGQHILSCSQGKAILVWDAATGERVAGLLEGDGAKLSFTDSEIAPYIIIPPCSNKLVTGAFPLLYCFSLENGVVGGVVNSGVDTWLYAGYADTGDFLMLRYSGQLIMIKLAGI